MSGRFENRVALVTGAAGGLGREIALALAAEGAHVGAAGRDAGRLAATVAEIERNGGRALAIEGDVRSEPGAERAVADVVDAFGWLDVVAHAAAVMRPTDVVTMSEAEWDDVLATNLKSCFLLAKHAVPAMRARGGGAVVNVSSIFARAAIPGWSAYAASKAGMDAFTRVVALEHATEGIRFNCVLPGTMRTPGVERDVAALAPDDPEALLDKVGRTHPIGRLIEPDEVAAATLFLLSDAASGITGTSLVVDGGRLAHVDSPE